MSAFGSKCNVKETDINGEFYFVCHTYFALLESMHAYFCDCWLYEKPLGLRDTTVVSTSQVESGLCFIASMFSFLLSFSILIVSLFSETLSLDLWKAVSSCSSGWE